MCEPISARVALASLPLPILGEEAISRVAAQVLSECLLFECELEIHRVLTPGLRLSQKLSESENTNPVATR